MKEQLTQLGLVGFGKESDLQSSKPSVESTPVRENEPNIFIIPKNTTVFRRLNPDLGMTATSAFYVKKADGAKVSGGMVKVSVDQDGVEVYRDGQRSVLSKGEVLEVPVKRLIKKQRDGM